VPLQAPARSGNQLFLNNRCHIGTDVCSVIRVPLHQCSDIKFGLLDHLDLTNVAVLDGEDARCFPLDLLSGGACNQRLDQGLEISLPSQGGHGGDHLLADGSDLRRFGITRFLQLVILFFREGNAKHAHDISIGRPSVNIALNDTLLLLDQRAKLVASHVHAMEVKKTVVPLHVLDTELHLAIAHGLVVVEVSKGELNDAALESIRSDFGSLGFGDDGLAAFFGGEDGGSNELVPLLLEEGVNCLLLSPLLGLRESLVLSLLYSNEMDSN